MEYAIYWKDKELNIEYYERARYLMDALEVAKEKATYFSKDGAKVRTRNSYEYLAVFDKKGALAGGTLYDMYEVD